MPYINGEYVPITPAPKWMKETLDAEDATQKRRSDTHPGQLVGLRGSLSARLLAIGKNLQTVDEQVLGLAAQTLARDEAENAAMIDELVRAGYRDVGPRVNSALIRRLLGYITPL